jgi:hypothetical protein
VIVGECDLAGCDLLAEADLLGHVFAWLLWIVVIHLLPTGMLFRAFVPAAKAPIGSLRTGVGAC